MEFDGRRPPYDPQEAPTDRGEIETASPDWLRDAQRQLLEYRDIEGEACRRMEIDREPLQKRPPRIVPRPQPAHRPEPEPWPEVNRPPSRRRFLKFLGVGAAVGGVATIIGPPFAYFLAKSKGKDYLEEAIRIAETKHAIAIRVRDPDLEQDTVGYIYGPRAETSKELWGHDRAIPVNPRDLEIGRPLHWWYKGLMELEDKGHEGGTSDSLGIDVKGTLRALAYLGRRGSGSNIADQTCKSLRAGQREYEQMGRLRKMLVDKSCGIALGTTKSPREIGAYYATFAFLGPGAPGVETFSRLYWRFQNGTRDEKMTVGHQLVLSAMVRYTWNGQNGDLDKRWEHLNHRAKIAAIRLLHDPNNVTELCKDLNIYDPDHVDEVLQELGHRANRELKEMLLTEEFKEQIKEFDNRSQRIIIARQWLAFKKLMEQIDAARPYAHDQVKEMSGGMGISPTPGYDFPIYLAAQEAKALFGDTWREVVESITITLDPNAQFTAQTEARKTLERVRDNARACVLAINDRGEIAAAYSGGKEGYDNIDRTRSSRSPGSIGKTILALGVAKKGEDIERHDAFPGFHRNLALSNSSVIEYAKQMGVDPDYVEDLMACYGTLHPDRGDNPLWGAAMGGSFAATPEQMLRLMMEPQLGGGAIEKPRIVHEFRLKNGTTVPGRNVRHDQFQKVNDDYDRRRECSRLADPASYMTFQRLMEGPIKEPYGTFKQGKNVADIGKTGTVGEVSTGKTNMALAIATASVRRQLHGVVAIIGADRLLGPDGKMIAINDPEKDRALGGEVAGPLVAAVLKTIKQRVEEGKIY